MSTQVKCLFKINKKDGSSWKRVLLTWINHCGFLGRNYYNIEQTNIYEFFGKFREQISNWSTNQVDLSAFLKEHYPAIELHTDDNQQLSSSDYMYIYSVFLHFCCVKYPTEFFQNICQNFHEAHQQAIAIFFKGLLEKDVIDKVLLRKLIAEASLQNICSIPVESPAKSQQNYKISPPTPKTHMLEEKNKELHILKASLETEKYERGYLEIQNKQYEEKIKKLENERKHYLSELQDLRGRFSSDDNSSNSSSCKNSVNIQEKNRLQKLLYDKEELIFDLKQNLDSLSEEKDLIKEKLKYAQNEMSIYFSKISEMEFERTKLLEDIEKKDETLRILSDAKNELEDIVNELQSQNRCVLDQSSSLDYLDLSSSHNSNSSNSLGCGENLGRTVVDIQLREKENENMLLQSEIEKLQNDNSSLSRHISGLIKVNYDIFDICQENLITDESSGNINHNFMIFENYFKKLVENYKQTNLKAKQFCDEKSALELQLKNLNEEMVELDKVVISISELLTSESLIDQNVINQTSMNYKTKLENYIKKIKKELSDRNIIIRIISENYFNLPKVYLEIFESENQYSETVNEISKTLTNKWIKIIEILKTNIGLAEQTELLKFDAPFHQNSIEKFIKMCINMKSEKKNLISEKQNLKEKFQNQERRLDKMTGKFESVVCENEKLIAESLNLRNQIDEYHKKFQENLNDSRNKQTEYENLNNEYLKLFKCKEDLFLQIEILNDKIVQITSESSKEVEKLLETVNEKNIEIKSLKEHNNNLLLTTKNLETTVSNLRNELEKLELNCLETTKMREAFEKDNDNLIENAKKLTKQLQETQNQITSLTTKNEQLAGKYDESINNIAMLKSQIIVLKNKITTNQETLENIEIKRNELVIKNQTLQKKIDSIEEKERSLNSRNIELTQSLKENLKKIDDLKIENESFKERCEIQSLEIQKHLSRKEDLDSLLKQKVDELSSLQSKHDEIKLECDKKNFKIKDLLNQINEQKSKISNNEFEIEKLKKSLLVTEKENLEFSNTIESLTICKLNAEDEVEDLKLKLDAKDFELVELNTKFENELGEIVQYIENNVENFLEPEIIVSFLESGLSSDLALVRLRKAINTLLNNNKCLLYKKESLEQEIQTLNIDIKNSIKNFENMEDRLKQYEKLKIELENQVAETNQLVSSRSIEFSKQISIIIEKLKKGRVEFEKDFVSKNYHLKKTREYDDIKNQQLQQINSLINQVSIKNNEKQQFLNEILDLKQSMCTVQTEIFNLKSENDSMARENADLVKKCASYKEENELMLKELDEKSEKINQIKRESNILNNEIEKFQIDAENLLHNIKNITAEKELKSKELLEKITENIEFQQKIHNLQNQIDLANKEKKSIFDHNLILDEKYKSMKLELDRSKEVYETLQHHFDGKAKELEEIKNECFKITTENWELKCERDDLVQKLKIKALEVEELRESLKIKIEELQNEIRELLENKCEQNVELETKENTNLKLSLQVQELTQQIKSICSEHAEEILDFKAKLKAIEETNAILENKNELGKETLEQLISENKEYIRELNEKYQNELNTLKLNCDNYMKKFEENSIEINKLSEECSALNLENSKLRREIDSKESLIDKSTKENEELNAKLVKLKEHCCLLEKENIALNDKLELLNKLNNNVSNLTEELNEMNEKYNKVTAELQSILTEKQILIESQQKNEENLEKINKNLEIKSFRLGEEQGRTSKLMKEVEQLKKNKDDIKLHLENLQKDYLKLQSDCKSLQIKLLDQEKNIDTLKAENELLAKEKEILTTNLKAKTDSETDLKKLFSNLQATENAKSISLNDTTSALSELKDAYEKIKSDKEILEKRNIELETNIIGLNEQIKNFNNDLTNEIIIDLQKKLEIAYEENGTLNDKLSKISIQVDITNTSLEDTKSELHKCKDELTYFQNETKNIEKDYTSQIEELQKQKDELIAIHEKEEIRLKEKLNETEELLEQNKYKLKQYEEKIEILKLNKYGETENINKKYELLELTLKNEQAETKKLRKDLEIFHAKLLKSRQLNDENEKKWLEEKRHLEKQSEEKIKENRIELEGKLEKMKNRMKSLYNEEVTKLKKKNEAEIFDCKAENQVLQGKCQKYDQHIKSLSKNVMTLTERVCELERDNQFMESKLKNYESNNRNLLRPYRPHSSTLTAPPLKNLFDGNFRIEDEEGEILNNTYLADIDFGGRDSISTQELQFRNSLAPPHLRSAYLAQYGDTQLTEEDVKDGLPPINLDDSLTSLMSGHRKKLAGTTSYKKPGPPTPSKSGGRLSFGGNSEVHASILKEYNENEQKKTPAKFKLFSSRSSAKDENTPPKRRSISNIFRKK
ncbi:uncharacterized protein LOC129605466 [Condylostylus longicornis]|uniref:uncharacterized protein LOC129605466 n=1 Tax=Condylostylus longicornis TaxID=2530218 RepID=UPI00244DF03F|nr:uncharacterized protein LOC129605466 [Condylostylus longicornis]